MAQEAKLLKTVPFSPIQKVGQPFVRTIEGESMFVDHRTYDFEPGWSSFTILAGICFR